MFVLKYFFEDKIANQKHFKVSHGSSWLTPIKKKRMGRGSREQSLHNTYILKKNKIKSDV